MSGILFNVCSMQLTGGRPGQQLACRPHLRGGFREEPQVRHFIIQKRIPLSTDLAVSFDFCHTDFITIGPFASRLGPIFFLGGAGGVRQTVAIDR